MTKQDEPSAAPAAPVWNDEGLHFVRKVGRRCRLSTRYNGKYWTCAVRGEFSSSGDTREESIRNACN